MRSAPSTVIGNHWDQLTAWNKLRMKSYLFDVYVTLQAGGCPPEFDVVVDPGRGQDRLVGVRSDPIDDMAIRLEDGNDFARLAVPNEDVSAIRSGHDVMFAPKGRLVYDGSTDCKKG